MEMFNGCCFLQSEALTRGEHKALESPESSSSLPLSMLPTFWPPWPVLSPHDEMHTLAMAWLFLLLSWALSTARLHIEAISLPLQGTTHMILLWGKLSHPLSYLLPHCLSFMFPWYCFHLYYNTSHNVTCSSFVYSSYGHISQWRLGTASDAVYNITLSSAFAHGGRKTILSSPDPFLVFPLLCSVLLSYWSTSLNGSFSHIY